MSETKYRPLLDAVKALDRMQAASLKAAEARSNLPPGSSRARVTTANANWARKAEHRDRLDDNVETEILKLFPHLDPARLEDR